MAAILASLMDGERTLAEIQEEFQRQFKQPVELADLEGLVQQLDERYFLDNERFRARWKQEVETYLNHPVRPAAHAGGRCRGPPATRSRRAIRGYRSPARPTGSPHPCVTFR